MYHVTLYTLHNTVLLRRTVVSVRKRTATTVSVNINTLKQYLQMDLYKKQNTKSKIFETNFHFKEFFVCKIALNFTTKPATKLAIKKTNFEGMKSKKYVWDKL